MPNFQKNCQNRHLKVLNDSSHEMYCDGTPAYNSVECFRSYGLQRSFSRNLGDHHLTTVHRKKNRMVRECHKLLLHVRVLFPIFCSFRRSGRVLPKNTMIVGAWLSNPPI